MGRLDAGKHTTAGNRLGSGHRSGDVVGAGVGGAGGAGRRCDNRSNNTYQKLLECMTLDGVQEHSGGVPEDRRQQHRPGVSGTTRAAGTTGTPTASTTSPACSGTPGTMVTLDPVESTYDFPAVLRQLTPVQAEYETGVFNGSGSGVVTGNVVPVDINLTPPRASTSGCDGAFTEAAVGAPIVADPAGPERLRRLPRRQHRPDPAGWLQLRAQGLERPGRWSIGRHHLQPGQHAGSRGPVHRQRRSPAEAALLLRSRIPVVGASFADGVALAQPGSTAFVEVMPARPASTTTSSRSCRARTRTTW